MTRPSTGSHLGNALRRLLAILCGILLFVVLASVLGIWALGRFAPAILDSALASRTGAHLSVADNQTNFFAGRVEFGGLTVTNPTRWQEREFLKVRRLALSVSLASFLADGERVIHEAELDIDRLVLVGKEDYLADNNAQDILRALKSTAPGAPTGPEQPAPTAAKRPFRIEKLRVRVGHVLIVAGDGTSQRRQVTDADYNLVFEVAGVTDRNFVEKVTKPLGEKALSDVAKQTPAVLLDLATVKLRRSVTERLQKEEASK